MSEGLYNKQNLLVRGADNVLPSPHGGDDEFFDVLVRALEEVAGLQRDESPHRETDDLLLLLEENARLRKLAVQLSNLLGDLPPFSSVAPTGAADETANRSLDPETSTQWLSQALARP
ncbi:hypothetical protein [Bradyrhizobium canariense]|uniref:Uncharacterized protein n=1 Tax=Bradyrhizobium canariense TaxID=255045 RepID=A0A1H1QMG3_9BRAD|nr:hypothetical protein [Bradyrhizobium canariense]SDS24642.1 hypothetical protein SAMN05444158_1459 [Bradyrhizobium canariense]